MYLPRSLVSHLYQHLVRAHHSLSPPVLILTALEPDALCACRILTALLKRDFIAHKIQPIAGYADLQRAGENMVQPMRIQQGGSGGVVVCLGVGGLVDMSSTLGLDIAVPGEDPSGGVEVWLIDARRPWNLGNVFAGDPVEMVLKETGGDVRSRLADVNKGQIQPTYKPGQGGIIVYDDGDIEDDLAAEREAYCGLKDMEDVEGLDGDSDDSGTRATDQKQLTVNAPPRSANRGMTRRMVLLIVKMRLAGPIKGGGVIPAARYHRQVVPLPTTRENVGAPLIIHCRHHLHHSLLHRGKKLSRQYAFFVGNFDD
ncbi:hypothetical protein ABVK25_002451 [Lepraria finkii]|uniref:Uncharacterized protein n=1 Tax=Lepraria finkii TaxID=1340010 RepID=A0ABR4BN71_9LECA